MNEINAWTGRSRPTGDHVSRRPPRRWRGQMTGGPAAVLSMALTYGMIFGPMWKVNVLIVATIALTWIFGRQKRELVRA